MNLSSRVTRLETRRGAGEQIAVWCDDVDGVLATIEAMVAAGELQESDRPRCVHWTVASGAGRHEPALVDLA
jgi:hypothetical protein